VDHFKVIGINFLSSFEDSFEAHRKVIFQCLPGLTVLLEIYFLKLDPKQHLYYKINVLSI